MKLPAGTPLIVSLRFSDEHRLPVGRMAMDRGTAILEYDPAFLATGFSLNPIAGAPGSEPPAPKDPRVFEGLPGVVADSLPDSWGELLIQRRTQRANLSYASLTALDKLAIVGERGMGALVYAPAQDTPPGRGAIELDAIARESIEILEGHESDITTLLDRLGGSSGGTRPKILVAVNGQGQIVAGDGDIPDGYDAWLIKFRSSHHDPRDSGPIEAAYADMARSCDVELSETRVFPGKPYGYFGTRRFDRPANNERLHVASVAGLLEMDWRVPGIDYSDLLKVVRAMARDQQAVTQAYRRAVFNVLAHNRDDHVKQHAFIMNETGQWRLAPAYDLVFSRGPGGEHYLAIGGRGGDDMRRQHIIKLGTDQGITKALCEEIIERTAQTVRDLPRFAQRYDVSQQTLREICLASESVLLNLTGRGIPGFTPAVHADGDEAAIDDRRGL
jgi:serine/threonine-protein kinase HipA